MLSAHMFEPFQQHVQIYLVGQLSPHYLPTRYTINEMVGNLDDLRIGAHVT